MTAPNNSVNELLKSSKLNKNNSINQEMDPIQDNEFSKLNKEISSNESLAEVPKIITSLNDKDVNDDDDDDDNEKLKSEKNKQMDDKQSTSTDNSLNYSKYLTYEGDLCIYTEPETGNKLVWNAQENKWIPKNKIDNENNSELIKNYEFDGYNYIYTDKITNIVYKFDQNKNEWIVNNIKKENNDNFVENIKNTDNKKLENILNDNNIIKTEINNDIEYFWDNEKNAWFPKVDDNFMAIYQLNYGFTDSNITNDSKKKIIKSQLIPKIETKIEKEQKKLEFKRKAAEPSTWFDIDEAHNTSVYIYGLPLDISMDELIELVEKYGVVARDDNNKNKIKLYLDSDGNPKGDAVCTYIKIESVDLALKFLDGTQIRGKTISAQRAKFQMKGLYDPSLKPKRKKKDKDRRKKIQEKLFDWRPERLPNESFKYQRIVILKNLFTPKDFEKDVTLSLEYKQDIQSECIKCGEVTKVIVFDTHPEGAAKIIFRKSEDADKCVQIMNGRWFGQRKITAEMWDGKTKYKINETEEEIEARINKWDKYLEDDDEKNNKSKIESCKNS